MGQLTHTSAQADDTITKIQDTQSYKLDGSNYIDVHPTINVPPLGASAPDTGSITIGGITKTYQLWAETETEGVNFELNHQYKDGANCDIHLRIVPATNNAGIVNFTYAYYVQKKDGTISAGTTVNLTTTIVAGDQGNNVGRYLSAIISGTGLVYGDMICGQLTRVAGTYTGDIGLNEVGMHIPVGGQGKPLA